MHKGGDELLRTNWFSSNLFVVLGVSLPMWLIGGLLWGWFMQVFLGGHVAGWLLAGVLWGVCCGLLFSAFLIVPMREIVLRVPLEKSAGLAERLAEAAQSQRYFVEEKTPEVFLCKPRFGLARLLQCNQVAVQVQGDSLLLRGPAGIVKKIRGKLS
jgi:hypothetical protein